MRTFFDVNHRSRQWTWEEAAPVLREALGDVDVLLAGGHDLARLLDADGEPVELARAAIARYGHDAVVLRENEHAGEQVIVTVTAVTADEVLAGALRTPRASSTASAAATPRSARWSPGCWRATRWPTRPTTRRGRAPCSTRSPATPGSAGRTSSRWDAERRIVR